MFCTSKEQQTCDVEKQGCEGCYYNGMSEEEIIEFIDQVNGIQREYKHKPILEKNIVNVGIAIQSALNLYQQEKEKNKKLQEEKEAFARSYGIAVNEEADNYFLMSKVIDMLVENIVEYHVPYDYCMAYGKNPDECDVLDNNEKCKECIKEYYFKKAEGE